MMSIISSYLPWLYWPTWETPTVSTAEPFAGMRFAFFNYAFKVDHPGPWLPYFSLQCFILEFQFFNARYLAWVLVPYFRV